MEPHENGNSSGGSSSDKLPDEIAFHYIKSNQFRVIHCSGVFGGLTGRNEVSVNLWSERPPIPRRIVHEITPEGSLGAEKKSEREVREGIIREVEVSAILRIEDAESMGKWLLQKVDEYRKLTSDAEQGD